LIQKKVRNYKLEKHGSGCAIHMKEYRIMMYLANQIPWSNKEPFGFVDNFLKDFFEKVSLTPHLYRVDLVVARILNS
jgi:hypothetical protein